MTAAWDEIDDLVDWQLEKRIGLWTSPIFTIEFEGFADGHRKEGHFIGGARWTPGVGWGYVNHRGELYETGTEYAGNRPDYWNDERSMA